MTVPDPRHPARMPGYSDRVSHAFAFSAKYYGTRPPATSAMAYLAHVEVTADHFDGAMLLAVDASLLTESPTVHGPSRALWRG